MHTMFCSHHSTIFLSSFKFYPSFSSFPNPKYTHFHLSLNEHSFLSFDLNQLGTLFYFILDFRFFWLSSFLFFPFSHSLIVSLILFFFLEGGSIYTLELLFSNFLCPQEFLFFKHSFWFISFTQSVSFPRLKEFKLTNPKTILEASLNEVPMLTKDENNPLVAPNTLKILHMTCYQ